MGYDREKKNESDIVDIRADLKTQVGEIADLKNQVGDLQTKLEELVAALQAAAKKESAAGAKKDSGAGGPDVDWDTYDKKVMAFEKARREVERCGAKIAKLTDAEAKEYAGKVDAARTAEMELSLLSGRIAHSLLGESDAVRWEVVTSSHRPGGSYPAFCGGGGPGGTHWYGGCGYGPGPGGSYPAFCGGGGPGGSYPAFCGGGGPGGSYPAFCGGGGPGGSYPAFCGGGGPGGSYPAFCGGGGPGGSYPAFCGGGGPGGSYPAFCGGGGPGGSYPAFCGGG